MVDIDKDQLQAIIRQLKRQQLTNANREALIKILEGLVGEAGESNFSHPEKSRRLSTTTSPDKRLAHPNEGLFDRLSFILGEIRTSLPGFDEAYIFAYTQGRLEMITTLVSQHETQQDRTNPRPHGLTYSVARLGQTMVIPNMAEHTLYAGSNASGAIVGLPLKSGHRVIGVLTVSRKPAGEFSQAEMDQLQGWVDRLSKEIDTQRASAPKSESSQADIPANLRTHLDLKAQLGIEIKQALETGSPLALVLIDLGKVGDISQAYGRRAGDYLHQAVATAISEALRKTDMLINYDSNRWAVILKGADEVTAKAIRDRIDKMLNRRRFGLPGENTQSVSIKMGVATFPNAGANPDMLVEAAEHALARTDGGSSSGAAGLSEEGH